MPKNNNHEHSIQLDESNNNAKFQHATVAELDKKNGVQNLQRIRS